jgi:hypothetical protein
MQHDRDKVTLLHLAAEPAASWYAACVEAATHR